MVFEFYLYGDVKNNRGRSSSWWLCFFKLSSCLVRKLSFLPKFGQVFNIIYVTMWSVVCLHCLYCLCLWIYIWTTISKEVHQFFVEFVCTALIMNLNKLVSSRKGNTLCFITTSLSFSTVVHHAQYQVRRRSSDLEAWWLGWSRPVERGAVATVEFGRANRRWAVFLRATFCCFVALVLYFGSSSVSCIIVVFVFLFIFVFLVFAFMIFCAFCAVLAK